MLLSAEGGMVEHASTAKKHIRHEAFCYDTIKYVCLCMRLVKAPKQNYDKLFVLLPPKLIYLKELCFAPAGIIVVPGQ